MCASHNSVTSVRNECRLAERKRRPRPGLVGEATADEEKIDEVTSVPSGTGCRALCSSSETTACHLLPDWIH